MNYEERRGLSLVLTVLMHLAIGGLLYFGVQWQTKPPEPVEVELWSGAPEPAPRPVKTPPPPKPRPVEPREEPREAPEPPKPPRKADIEEAPPKKTPKPVEKKPEPKPPELKPPPKPEPKKPEPKKEIKPAPKPPLEEAEGETPRDKPGRLKAAPADASASLSALAARQEAAEAGERASAYKKALDSYLGQVRNKVRRNMTYPDDGPGNPEAEFEVVLLPDMTILEVTLRRSSGNSGFDEAVKRALLRTAEYPALPGGIDFRMLRRHTLKYRLHD
ncbi:energy transducer TonB [Chitinimonas lacunae]|uniref:TonB C-terminal domain-containing protein n=1 Tax=Chitinimonas lacunae TaxID=1963018 RepID=A0ABV8MUY5_9NEIS